MIELENFSVLEVKRIDRAENAEALLIGGKLRRAPHSIRQLTVKPGKWLRVLLKDS